MTTRTNGAARRRVMGALAMSTALGLAPLVVPGRVSANTATVSVSLVGLAQGVRGDAVRTLQQKLIAAGIAVPGGADGIFGPGTATALKQFQNAKGLPATGTVDAATAAALEAVTSGSTTTVAPTPPPATPSTTFAPIATTTTIPTTIPTPSTTSTATSAPPASATATPSGTIIGLQLGDRGDLVRTLQQYLVTVGQTSLGRPDGVFGVRTASALSTFQRSAGLPGNAVVDQATASALLDAVARAGGSTSGAGGNTGTGGTGGSGGNTGSGNTGSGTPGATSPLLGLQYGSRGAAVRTLQQTLMQAGVSLRGGADGVFGLSTQGALKQYQQLVGLPTTGVVDEATASALASGKSVTGGTTTLVGLKSGSAGNAVKALQQALIAAGVTVRGGADGVFGPATSQALKTFQTSQGLPATGVVDEATAAALRNPKPPTTPPTTPPATTPPTTTPVTPPTTVPGTPATTTPATTTPVTPPTTTPPPPTGSTTGYAVYGEKGARVVALQQALVRAGIVVRGGVDGDFGSGTTAAVMDFQRASGLPITGRVDDATAARLGLAKQDPPVTPSPGSVRLAVFPVQGRCSYVDTWLAPRSGGRQHLGVDIIAPQGKAIYAVTDGTISKIYTDHPGSLSGNGVRLSQPDGTYFFYAHMLSLAPGIAVGTPVKAGQIIGLVGTTGSSSTNHLHLEVHPKGGAAINPYPLVRAIDACSVTSVRPQP